MGIKILVVDDDDQYREMVTELLELNGHTVIQAGDGSAAQELATQNKPIDILLTDLRMPNTEGFETVAHFQLNYPDTKVIIMSGTFTKSQSDGLLEPVCRDAGAKAFLPKPFTEEMLLRAIEESLA